jgi:hypothetical protein
VKWVKGNLLAGRTFADDADLVNQSTDWTTMANGRPSDATGVPPIERLAQEAAKGGALPRTAQDYGFLHSARVGAESLIHLGGNAYSVPIAHVGRTLTVRLHQERVDVFHETVRIASHPRAPDGAGARLVAPAHFQPLFTAKPRAQLMLYREVLLGLGDEATAYVSELSRRRRDRLRPEILGVHALLEQHGAQALLTAMEQAAAHGAYGTEYLDALLQPALAPPLPAPALVVGTLPAQEEIDRHLSQYEPFVTISAGGSPW